MPSPAILLIDDDDFIAVSLRHYLIARGCEVTSVTDSRAAEEQMAAKSYDLVLLDPYMTGEAGRERGSLLESVRALQPGAPIVLVSAYLSPARVAAASDVVAVTKPQPVMFLSQLVMSALHMNGNSIVAAAGSPSPAFCGRLTA